MEEVIDLLFGENWEILLEDKAKAERLHVYFVSAFSTMESRGPLEDSGMQDSGLQVVKGK